MKPVYYKTLVHFSHLGRTFNEGTVLEFICDRPELEAYLFKQPEKDSNGNTCAGTIGFDYDSVELIA
jgi:hypothetical protein